MDFEKLAKYFSGEMSLKEKEDLFSDLLEDENHLNEFARLKNLWAMTKLQPAKSDKKSAKKAWRFFTGHTLGRKSHTFFLRQAAMIMLLLGIVGSALYFWREHGREEILITYSVLTVPTGQTVQVLLPDSSEVWLNSQSKLSYPNNFGAYEREVILEGEGFFKVYSDKEHPFVVKTGMIDIIATGTQFNVSAYDDDNWISATLIEGVINLYSEQNEVNQQVEVGQKATFDSDLNKIFLETTDGDSEISWIKGEFRFQDMNMEDLARRLERNYNVSFVFKDSLTKKRRFTGSFYNNQSIDNILKVLSSQQLHYQVKQDTVYIYR